MLFHGVLSGAANVTMEFYRRVLNEQLRIAPSFPIEALTARMAVRGRTMNFDDEAVGRFIAQEQKSRIFEICACLLYPRTDWQGKDWQIVQVIPTQHLLDDRLRVQGVEQEEIKIMQSWAHRLANYVVMTDDEARGYYSMDLEDWVRAQDSEFFGRHHLPDDTSLYAEYNFLDFIRRRRELIRAYLQSILGDRLPSGDAEGLWAALEAEHRRGLGLAETND